MKPSIAFLIATAGLMFALPAYAHHDCDDPCDSIKDQDCRDAKDECCEHKTAHSAAFAPQIIWLDEKFLTRIRNFEPDMKKLDFPFDRNFCAMLGSLGYSRVSDAGFRAGGGWWVGYREFHSPDSFERVLPPDTAGGDTLRYNATIILRMIPMYAGFLGEKAFEFPGFNMFCGFMFGGGAYMMHKQIVKRGDLFVNTGDDSLNWKGDNNGFAIAPLIIGDLHAGATVSLSPAAHLALEGFVLLSYAPDGFVTGNGFGDFYTISPGIRMRVLFGKAG